MRKNQVCALLLSGCLAMSVPFNVLAKTHEVSNYGDMDRAISTDTDQEIIIMLKADVECAGEMLKLKGQTVTINGNTYVLRNVTVVGTGDLTVNGNVEGGAWNSEIPSYALSVLNESSQPTDQGLSVLVNGNVTGGKVGVEAVGNSEVTVKGDITESDTGVVAVYGASVSAEGDVKANGKGVQAGDYYTPEDASEVSVGGDVESEGIGVEAYGKASVEVEGSVSGGEIGAVVLDEASLNVQGDIKAKDVPEEEFEQDDSVDKPIVEGPIDDPIIDDPIIDGRNPEEGAGLLMDSTATVSVGNSVYGANSDDARVSAGHGVVINLQLKKTETPQILMLAALNGEGVFSQINEKFGMGGSLTVKNLIQAGSGTGEDATAAIYYVQNDLDQKYEYLSIDDKEFEDPAEGIVKFLYTEYLYKMYEMSQAFGEEDAETIEQGFAAIKDMLDEIFDDPDISVQDAIAQLSEERQKEVLQTLIDSYNDLVTKMVIMPNVEVWGLDAGGDLVQVSPDDVDPILKQQLTVVHKDYTIKTRTPENGTLSVDKDLAKQGETVTVTVTPKEGYKVGKVFMKDGVEIKPVDGVYSFEVPEEGQIMVSAEFEKEGTEAVEKKSTSPQTGDMAAVGTYGTTMAGSIMAIGAALLGKKRKRNK